MNTKGWPLFGLFLIIALMLVAQPAAAQQFSGTGYEGVVDYIGAGTWQSYALTVTNSDDYNILALVYSEANDFALYVYDPSTDQFITAATAPYSTENNLNYIWAISTLKPGKYSVYVHSLSGSGNFGLLHFYKSVQTQPKPTQTTSIEKYSRGDIVGHREDSTTGWLVLEFDADTDAYSLLWVSKIGSTWKYREWEPVSEDRVFEEGYDTFIIGESDPDVIEKA